MTATQLLAYICAALLLQLVVGIGVVVWRRRGDAASSPLAAAGVARATSSGAWVGWREFRVARRVFEDEARTQCSFHLVPIDGAPLPSFKPGQFLTFDLRVADTEAGGQRAITRCYSLSDRPDPAGYRVTIKRVPPPADHPDLPPGASSTHFHDRVHEGDVLGSGSGRAVRHRPRCQRSGRPHRGRHRHHADDEHAALVPGRAAGAYDPSVLRPPARRRACVQADARGAGGLQPEFPPARSLQPPGRRRPAGSRLSAMPAMWTSNSSSAPCRRFAISSTSAAHRR